MNQSLGTRLRTQREHQQVSLSAISAKLKIKLSLLEQLETDRVANWPKGIFGRAYLRDYARSIGMDPEAVVREFLALHPDTTEDPFVPKEPAPSEAHADAAQPGARFRRMVTAAFGAVPAFRQSESARPAVQDASRSAADHHLEGDRLYAAQPDDVMRRTAAPPLATAHYSEPEDIPGEPVQLVAEVPAEPQPEPLLTRSEAEPADRRRGSDRRALSLSTAAGLCSRLARALDGRDVSALLAEAASLLDAVGVVVWLWDSHDTALRASVAHGYTDAVLASLPAVRPDESNAIAAAFRSGEPCLVDGADGATGAVVVPSLGPGGCVAVLAVEVRHGGERSESVRAFATILAAQLGALLPSPVAPAPSGA
jgi:hypothetical protein